MQLRWTESAAQDLDKIEEYISRENSPTIAINIVLQVIDTLEKILPGHPRAGRIGRVMGTRELVIARTPFVVVYRESRAEQLQILRVLHDAQQWPSTE